MHVLIFTLYGKINTPDEDFASFPVHLAVQGRPRRRDAVQELY